MNQSILLEPKIMEAKLGEEPPFKDMIEIPPLCGGEPLLEIVPESQGMVSSFSQFSGATSSIESFDTGHPSFRIDKTYFTKIKPTLMEDKNYQGKFVAVYNTQIIDSDHDNRTLARRVYERIGYVPVYIDQVTEQHVKRIPSPRVQRK